MDAVRLNLIYNFTFHFSFFYFNIIPLLFSYAFQVVSSFMVLESIFSCRLFLALFQEYYISYRVFIRSTVIGSTNCKNSRLDFHQPPVTFPPLAPNILPEILNPEHLLSVFFLYSKKPTVTLTRNTKYNIIPTSNNRYA